MPSGEGWTACGQKCGRCCYYYKEVAEDKMDPVCSKKQIVFKLKDCGELCLRGRVPFQFKNGVGEIFTNPMTTEVSVQIIEEEMILEETTAECGKKRGYISIKQNGAPVQEVAVISGVCPGMQGNQLC
ncbi:hypothetical protein Cadr_000003960 [Camelus dromedarius]|uniref:Uncharacterized protein n=1 Tax=Camelus dromedarius TaxID=9838 RepID=A0A5N4EEK3_CAMDR|nr:hypothetical protein Cadr_000003960 [Camelus dromedarius]